MGSDGSAFFQPATFLAALARKSIIMGAATSCTATPPVLVAKAPVAPTEFKARDKSGLEACAGWLEKRSRHGRWQRRYFKVHNKALFYGKHEDQPLEAVIDLAQVASVTVGPQPREFILHPSTPNGAPYCLRAADDAARTAWVSCLQMRVVYASKGLAPLLLDEFTKRAGLHEAPSSTGRPTIELTCPDGTVKLYALPPSATDSTFDPRSTLDSDEDRVTGFAVRQEARWLREYDRWSKDPEKEAKWMTMSMVWLEALYSAEAHKMSSAEAGGAATPEPVDSVQNLSVRTEHVCAHFTERVVECKKTFRADLIKHLVQMFDLKFLQEVLPLTTGAAPSNFTPYQILKLIDTLEHVLRCRSKALGILRLSAVEGRPGNLIYDTRKDLVALYLQSMRPKLESITASVVRSCLAHDGGQAIPSVDGRVGSHYPVDFLALMSEHLTIARAAGSLPLLRKLLSLVVVEINSYVNQIFWHVYSKVGSEKEDIDPSFLVLCINDMAHMAELVKELQAQHAPLIEAISRYAQSGVDHFAELQRPGALEEDSYAAEEAEEAQQDLDAVRQDFPRAYAELLKCASQLTGLLVDAAWHDTRSQLAQLFGPKWEADDFSTQLFSTLESKLNTVGRALISTYFDKFSRWLCCTFVTHYVVCLIDPAGAPAVGVKLSGGGFGNKFKLTPPRLVRLVRDELTARQLFLRYLNRELVTTILAPMHTAVGFLTSEPDILAELLEKALATYASATIQVYIMFRNCLDLRTDMETVTRNALARSAVMSVRTFGQPWDGGDDLIATVDSKGKGISSATGLSMAQSALWEDGEAAVSIFRIVVPSENARRCSELIFSASAGADVQLPQRRRSSVTELAMSSFVGTAAAGRHR